MDIRIIEKARKTAIEMLQDRGFTVPLDQHNISQEVLQTMLDNNNINIYVSKDASQQSNVKQIGDKEQEGEEEVSPEGDEIVEEGPAEQIEMVGGAHSTEAYVYFHISAGKFDKKKLVATVSDIRESYGTNDINIIIVVKDITAPVSKEVDSVAYSNVEVFYFRDLQSNKSKNRYVPRHELMEPEEIETIANKYGLTPKQFKEQAPTLFTTDPMAKYYGFRDGDMCRIYRSSKINGKSIAYRSVLKPIE